MLRSPAALEQAAAGKRESRRKYVRFSCFFLFVVV